LIEAFSPSSANSLKSLEQFKQMAKVNARKQVDKGWTKRKMTQSNI
jgi:hypothetical protein